MKKNIQLIKNMLGEDFFEEIAKTELYNLKTNTTLDPHEISIALKIVPRAVLSYLTAELKPMTDGSNKELHVPFLENVIIYVTKMASDSYVGEVTENNKKKAEFQYRSIPGIGLILMSNFELYDVKELDYDKKNDSASDIETLHKLIDERIRMKCLIKEVVDERLSERDAIKKLIAERLSEKFKEEESDEESSNEEGYEQYDNEAIEMSDNSEVEGDILEKTKKSKLKDFLDSREKKRNEKVQLDKDEKIVCYDCNTNIYKGEKHINLCLCYGQHYNKKIKVKKTEDGTYKFNFPKSFDTDNVELLLETIKSNKR